MPPRGWKAFPWSAWVSWPHDVRWPTFGHGPGTDICSNAAPLGGVLVASLQLNAIASKVPQARDDQRLLVHHFLEWSVLLWARRCAGWGRIGESRNGGHGRCHIPHITKGPAFPRRPVNDSRTHTVRQSPSLKKCCRRVKGLKPKTTGAVRFQGECGLQC